MSAQLASLDGDVESAITTAIHLHYGAVLLFDRDLAAAYTLLIAGLETLSRQFGKPPTAWADWDKSPVWDKFITRQKLTPEQAGALRTELLRDRQIRLKQTFVNYVADRLPGDFWEMPWQDYMYMIDAGQGTWGEGSWQEERIVADYLPRDREVLKKALKASYDARSSFVHSGQRIVNKYGQLRSLAYLNDGDQPLGFAVLRSILTAIIFLELEQNAVPYELPDMLLSNESAQAAGQQ